MTPLDRLLNWHSDWRVSSSTVECRHCGALQHEDAKSELFEHDPTCKLYQARINPWRELHEITTAFGRSDPVIRESSARPASS